MDRVAVVTLVTNPGWKILTALTLPTQEQYAKRIGADFIILDRSVFPHPHYDKWQVGDLLAHYDRILYLDADIIVRPDCPDLFVIVAPQYVGGEDELRTFPGQAEHLATFAQQLGVPMPAKCPHYLNAGLFLVSSCHRRLFRPPEAILGNLPWPEQSHFNLRLILEKTPLCLLPAVFNDRRREGDYLRKSFVLHYSMMSNETRVAAVRQDLAGWSNLFSKRRD